MPLARSTYSVLIVQPCDSAMADASAAGDDAWNKAHITGQAFRSRKALDVADLQPDERREDLADAGHGAIPIFEAKIKETE